MDDLPVVEVDHPPVIVFRYDQRGRYPAETIHLNDIGQLEVEELPLEPPPFLDEIQDQFSDFIDFKRFFDVMEGSPFASLLLNFRRPIGRHDDHLRLWKIPPNSNQQVQAIDIRHSNVRNNQVNGHSTQNIEGLFSVVSDLHPVFIPVP